MWGADKRKRSDLRGEAPLFSLPDKVKLFSLRSGLHQTIEAVQCEKQGFPSGPLKGANLPSEALLEPVKVAEIVLLSAG